MKTEHEILEEIEYQRGYLEEDLEYLNKAIKRKDYIHALNLLGKIQSHLHIMLIKEEITNDENN